MEKNISEKDLTRILGAQLEPSEIIDAKLSETYEILRLLLFCFPFAFRRIS